MEFKNTIILIILCTYANRDVVLGLSKVIYIEDSAPYVLKVVSHSH